MRRLSWAAGCFALLCGGDTLASTEPVQTLQGPVPIGEQAIRNLQRRDCQLFCYVNWQFGLGVGRGLRLNNPFRLQEQLGSSAESLSLTAYYADLAAAATFGDPFGFQQGVAINTSVALAGVPQEVIAPAYVALYRFNGSIRARARLGLPVVLEPDLNVGAEASLGGVWLFWSGLGFYTDVLMSVFQGAATDERSVTTVPVVSLQTGVAVSYESLP